MIIHNNFHKLDETESMVSVVTSNPVPHGELSIQERINRINALNKRGSTVVEQKYYQNKKDDRPKEKNYEVVSKNPDKRDKEGIQNVLDDYNLLQEKMLLEEKLKEFDRLDELERLRDEEENIYGQNSVVADSRAGDYNSSQIKSSEVSKVFA